MTDTEQSRLWKGDFGDAYIDRNLPEEFRIRGTTAMWAKILNCLVGDPPKSFLEVGSNVGNNLRALSRLTDATFYAVEPNETARSRLVADRVVDKENVRGGLAMDIDFPDGLAELSFTSGVLIHIHPDDLLKAYQEIYRVSSKYIVCIEYFADKPETILYHGNENALFKRDFGGFWLDNFPDLVLLDYGFIWKRATGLDDMNWWVFKKG